MKLIVAYDDDYWQAQVKIKGLAADLIREAISHRLNDGEVLLPDIKLYAAVLMDADDSLARAEQSAEEEQLKNIVEDETETKQEKE